MELSKNFKNKVPSELRLAQIEFSKREDNVKAVNVAIGNVSLPMHPALQNRMFNLKNGPFKEGVVKYSSTKGFEECQRAFLNIIASSGFNIDELEVQITEGASHAMELVLLAMSDKQPIMMIDASYANYMQMAQRVNRKIVSVTRKLNLNGKFSLPNIKEIEEKIKKEKPSCLIVIPYDNPTGQFYTNEDMNKLGELCVKYDMWMISDEAYRELQYTGKECSSIWGLTDNEIIGIEGRRISIESASKVWNSCGLRIGAIVSDNKEYIEKSVAENTANLCPNVIGQYIFGAMSHVSHDKLKKWYGKQRKYYYEIMIKVTDELKRLNPKLIVSKPEASIYTVVDVKNISKKFDSTDFVLWCAKEGKIEVNKEEYTLLVCPMKGFYNSQKGKSQMRLAFVDEKMELVPKLFTELLEEYLKIK